MKLLMGYAKAQKPCKQHSRNVTKVGIFWRVDYTTHMYNYKPLYTVQISDS